MAEQQVVIVGAVRTPFSRFDGAMRDLPSIRLGAMVIQEVLSRTGTKPEEVAETYYGTCIPAEVALEFDVPGRQATLLAGLPPESYSFSLDRACCSSMTTLRLAYRSIRSGDADAALSVGSENMSRTPFLARGLRWGNRLGHIRLEDPLFELGYGNSGFNAVSVDAGEVALEYGVDRVMQDQWGLQSQERCAQAYAEGRIAVGEELVAVQVPQKKGESLIVDHDESPRRTSMDLLAKLPTIYGSPTVTPGNAPPMNAGATAILLMSERKAKEKDLLILATIVTSQEIAMEPRQIATVPAYAIHKALDAAALTIGDMKLIEINEAFAAMPLVSTKILSDGDEANWKSLLEKTNVNGGAIAIGHPVGASGGRITMTLMYELRRRGGGYGVAAICGGLAQGAATILKV